MEIAHLETRSQLCCFELSFVIFLLNYFFETTCFLLGKNRQTGRYRYGNVFSWCHEGMWHPTTLVLIILLNSYWTFFQASLDAYIEQLRAKGTPESEVETLSTALSYLTYMRMQAGHYLSRYTLARVLILPMPKLLFCRWPYTLT